MPYNMIAIKKYISKGGVTLEIGDFYGEEVITSMEENGKNLRIFTSDGYYDLDLGVGDYLVETSGSAKLVKSKFDIQDE